MLRKKINYIGWKLPLGILIFFLFQITSGCQRDDICPESTQTTPLLRISFFDRDETDVPKPPVNLTVKATSLTDTLFERVNLPEIRIPLRPDSDITSYEFILNTPAPNDEEDNSNKDIVTFTYTAEQIYINRACSYKVNFLNLNASLEEGDDTAWMSSVIVQQLNIENETEPHIYIFH